MSGKILILKLYIESILANQIAKFFGHKDLLRDIFCIDLKYVIYV